MTRRLSTQGNPLPWVRPFFVEAVVNQTVKSALVSLAIVAVGVAIIFRVKPIRNIVVGNN